MIEPVQRAGHDAQLHVHTEWLRFEHTPWRPHTDYWNIHQFDVARQRAILARAIDCFKRCGGDDPVAFRAGNYGANVDTLAALADVGVLYDSSHNMTYMGDSCQMSELGELAHATYVGDIWEVPVTVFSDRPNHLHPVQLGACSFRETRDALEFASRNGHSTFVVVGHSFEFMNTRKDAPLGVVIARFRKLCRFLAENKERFRVIGFDEADPKRWGEGPHRYHRSGLGSTALRLAEQAAVRLAG